MANTTTFKDWQSGAISDREALRALLSDLGEVESQIAPLEAEKTELRAQISDVLVQLGGRAEADGFRLVLTAPSVVPRYDTKELDHVVKYLQAQGEDAIADLILRARKESARSGMLRIAKEGKPKPGDEEE
jgi:hypothetical protein